MDLARYRRLAEASLAAHEHAVRTVREEVEHLAKAEADAAVALECQQILQGVAKSVQTFAHAQISKVVTRCLKTVFGPGTYDFDIEFLKKRGKTEAKLRFLKDDHPCRPIGGSGGGTVAVAAFALRLAVLMLATPARRRVLFLDEPFRDVHGSEYQERLAELVVTLARECKVQFILVTGLPWLKIGKVVELT